MKKIVRENGITEYVLEPDDQKVTEVSREVLWQGDIEKLVVKEFWDSHGKLIYWDKQNVYNNSKVRLERVTRDYIWFGGDANRFTNDELFINDEKYEAIDVNKLTGDTGNAIAVVIVGQG